MTSKKNYLVAVIILFLLSANTNISLAQSKVKVATGGLFGDYYNIGLKFCRYLTKANKGLVCEVVPSSGSLENLAMLRDGRVDFAFTLSNLAVEAHQAKGHFAQQKPFHDMYQLLRLHQEVFTILVKDKDNINSFEQLNGLRITNGPTMSDSSTIYNNLIQYYNPEQAPLDIELAYEHYAQEYCSGNIDAIMLMTGHPSFLINMITHKCESDFLKLDDTKIKSIVKDHVGFQQITLPSGTYPGITESQNTIAVEAILVGSKRTDSRIAEQFLRIFPRIAKYFKEAHPALAKLDIAEFNQNFVLPAFGKKIINSEEK